MDAIKFSDKALSVFPMAFYFSALVVADLQSATSINKRGLQQYCAQASFRSPMFVTLRFPSA